MKFWNLEHMKTAKALMSLHSLSSAFSARLHKGVCLVEGADQNLGLFKPH